MSNPVIDSVVVDSAVTQITVSGSGFKPSTSAPSVRLNGSTLTVTSSSDSSFVASLPSGLSTGTYLLEVENSAAFWVTQFDVYIAQQSSLFIGWESPTNIIGAVSNIALSTTAVQLPAFGVGSNSDGIAHASGGNITDFVLSSDKAVPTGATQLQGTIKNITTGNSLGPVGINSGNYNSLFSANLVMNDGDQIAVILKVTGNPTTFSGIRWVCGFGD